MAIHILLITCEDEKGLIARISSCLFDHGLNIQVMREFVEPETNTFFMRCELLGDLNAENLRSELSRILPSGSQLQLHTQKKKDLVILATKEHHCLSDLLTRFHFGEINAEIKAVISNHALLEKYVSKFDIPFHFISHEGKSKGAFEEEIMSEISRYSPEFLVLAKFMRILSPGFVAHFENRIINIHHSFLPAFIGANPYRQAYERGVKLIGATAHFVNNHLDEGPIISQKVVQVDHNFTVKMMVQAGQEVEKSVLIEALHWVLEDKVFVSRNKTIVFI